MHGSRIRHVNHGVRAGRFGMLLDNDLVYFNLINVHLLADNIGRFQNFQQRVSSIRLDKFLSIELTCGITFCASDNWGCA